jgi:sec-independent protein translocase protein TatC
VVIIFALLFLAAFMGSDYVFQWLMTAVPPEVMARSGSMLDPFMMKIQIATYCGIFLALPVIIHQSYGFIRPALKDVEDKSIRMYIIGGFILLMGALAFTHNTLPYLIKALYSFVPTTREVLIQADIKEYVSNILTIYLGFSILFQIPLVVFLTIVQGFVESTIYTEHRKWVVVILLILCAVFSPPNVESMILLFVPLYGLFEIAVVLGRFVKKNVRA